MGIIADPFRSSELAKIQVGQLDIKFSRRFTNYKSKNPGGGTRGEIRELSRQSRTRLIYSARNLPELGAMFTFTYPHEDYASSATGGDFMTDGLVVKNHLRKLRQMFTRRKVYGFWFLEFQKRGAPHFHFFLSKPLENKDIDKIRRNWHRMVGSSCEHHSTRGCVHEVLRKKHAAGAYAAKYSSKDEQKIVPERYKNVGRFWGLFGDIPERKGAVSVPLKEMFKMLRIARNAQKAFARAHQTKFKARDRGDGYSGATLYNTGLAMRYYIGRVYGMSDPPSLTVEASGS